eukprot:5744299-Ditylum_brightwellii.AAC.1
MRAAANEQKNRKWCDMRAAAYEQKHRKWRDMRTMATSKTETKQKKEPYQTPSSEPRESCYKLSTGKQASEGAEKCLPK